MHIPTGRVTSCRSPIVSNSGHWGREVRCFAQIPLTAGAAMTQAHLTKLLPFKNEHAGGVSATAKRFPPSHPYWDETTLRSLVTSSIEDLSALDADPAQPRLQQESSLR